MKKIAILLAAALVCTGVAAGDAKPAKPAKLDPKGTTPHAIDPKMAQVQPAPPPKKPEAGKVRFDRKKGEPEYFTAVVPGEKPARKKKKAD